MTRSWFVVHGADLVVNPKWRETGPLERGAVATLWVVGSVKDHEARWGSLDEIERVLRADGYPDGTASRLVALGWIDVADDGASIHEWDTWQKPLPKTDAERARDYRDRHERHAASPEKVTRHFVDDTNVTNVTRHDSFSSLISSSLPEGGAGGELDEVRRLIEERTGRAWTFGPGSETFETLRADLEAHGKPAYLAAVGRLPPSLHTAQQVVYGATKVLNPIPRVDTRVSEAREREQERERAHEARLARTQALIAPFRARMEGEA